MKTIPINSPPEIFDHPKFCGGPSKTGFEECRFLVYNEDCCFFLDEKEEFTDLESSVNEFDDLIAEKCPECAAHWKSADEHREIDKVFENLKDKRER